MNLIEEAWNQLTKGTKYNPYEYEEFPEYHCEGMTPDQIERLKAAWVAHPEYWGDPDADDEEAMQPDWDALFDLAGID